MHKYLATLVFSLGAFALLGGTASASDASPEPKTHVVEPGDSLSSIAETEKLDSWVPLWSSNTELSHPDLIFAGQKLIVPQGPVAERPLPEGVAARPVVVSQPVAYQAPRTAVQRPAPNYAQGVPGILAGVRQRESGGNYATNTGNGYYGAYQFDLSTWRGVGGVGLPSQASPAEQDMRAQMLFDRRGCSPWPNTCR